MDSSESRAQIRLQQLSRHFPAKSSLCKQTAAAATPCSATGAQKTFQLLAIGGGPAAAHFVARARRLCESIEITLLEPGPFVAAAHASLQNSDFDSMSTHLALQNNFRVNVHANISVIGIDRQKKEVYAKDKSKEESAVLTFPFDKLLFAPCASTIRPSIIGCSEIQPRVCTLRNEQDVQAILSYLPSSKRVTIIGGGFLGVQILEHIRRTKHVQQLSLVELNEHVLPQLDSEFSIVMENELRANGVRLYLKEPLKRIHHRPLDSPPWKGDHHMEVELENDERIPSDLTILSMTGQPHTQLAVTAQLATTTSGHIVVNHFMQSSDENIYAAGEGIVTKDLIYPDLRVPNPIGGSNAHRQARLAADHAVATLLNERLPMHYPGTLATSMVAAFSTVCAITGWSEHRLEAAEKNFCSALVYGDGHAAGSMKDLLLKILYSDDGHLLGAQVVGPEGCGVEKCIDVLAVACANRMTIEQLQHVELSQAPQLFHSTVDPINLAAFTAVNQWQGRVQSVSCFEDVPTKRMHVIDVRDALSASVLPLKSTRGMHVQRHAYATLRQWLQSKEAEDLKGSKDAIVVVCTHGKTSYFAARILQQSGFADVFSMMGGLSAALACNATNPQAKAITLTMPSSSKL